MTFFRFGTKFVEVNWRRWSLVIAAIFVVVSLNGIRPASSTDLTIAGEAAAAKAVDEQKLLLSLLDTEKRVGERLKLIRQLSRGFVSGPKNPLRRENTAEAVTRLQSLVSTTSGNDKIKVEKLLFELLGESNLKTDREKVEAMLTRQPLLSGPPPLELSVDISQLNVKQVAELKLRLQQGLPMAGFLLAEFEQKSNPAEAKAHRDQALYLATLNAQSSPSAAMFLASIHIDGRAGAKNGGNAMAAFELAVDNGSNSGLAVMDSHFDDPLFADQKPRMKALIEHALISGSDMAAEVLILDESGDNHYGFAPEDALWAWRLLNEIKSPRSVYVNAKLYAEGKLVARDMRQAEDLLGKLSDVSQYVDEYQFAVGTRILKIDLPPKYYYAYALPIFSNLVGSKKTTAINRAASLINNAMRDGFFSTTQDLPIGADRLIVLLTESFQSGDWSSGLLLGDIFQHGFIFSADLAKASKFYAAVSQGSSDLGVVLQADEALAKIAQRGTNLNQDKSTYDDKLKSLAERGSLWAKKEYGSLLLAEKSDRSDVSEAGVELLFQDIEANYFSASSRLLKYAVQSKRDDVKQRLITALQKKFTKNPSRAVTMELAQAYGVSGKVDEGIALLKQKEWESDPEIIFIVAKIGLEGKKITEKAAFDEIERAISLTSSNDVQLLKYARYILSEKQKAGIVDAHALDIVERFADRGDIDAVELGLKYLTKDIAAHPERLSRAIDWVTRQAKVGQPELLLNLVEKQIGKNSSQSNNAMLVKAVEENLAQMGDRGSARNILAIAYQNGFGVAADVQKAKTYRMEAAILGSPSALYDMGTSYLYGIEEERNLVKAERLISAASLFSSNKARIAEGRLNSAAFGSTFSEFQAFAKNKEAADAGSLAGMIETGRAYLAGSGVEKDTVAGLMWLEKAASKESPFAASQLYFYYATQNPSIQNEKARFWLEKAIQFGHSPSLVRKAALLQAQDPVGNATEIQALLNQSIAKGHNLTARYKAKIAKDKPNQ